MLSRAESWERLDDEFDILIAGGGVTGAAIALEGARRGLRVALVERGDFASGTSSRSSKLIHGGLRYLREGKIGLMRESVRERESLLRHAPGLVEPMPFLLPHYRGKKPGRALSAFGLFVYDALAGRRTHRYLNRDAALELEPAIESRGLTGAHVYTDATTDDARLVLRLLQDAEEAGAVTLNYAEVVSVLREHGRAAGALVIDRGSGRERRIRSRCVVSATGVFADELRSELGHARTIRPLRGSHLLFTHGDLPLAQAVAFAHPRDGRPVFAYPWLGMTLAGTTDLDHVEPLSHEPSITPQEVTYLLEALESEFPRAALDAGKIVATYAGVRPIAGGAHRAPSQESRDSALFDDEGLVTITGGKLTTFRPMAMAALRAASKYLERAPDLTERPVFSKPGAYGALAERVREAGELRWALRAEKVEHLDDLLLRRTRFGLQHRDGGEHLFAQLRELFAAELAWDEARWEREASAYLTLRRTRYGVPA